MKVRGSIGTAAAAAVSGRARLSWIPLGAALALALCACRGGDGATSNSGAPIEATGPAELPPLILRDDTPDLLLTWVDAEGDFHVTERIADVPADRRAQVRVVKTDHADGTGQIIYVADLREKLGDGTYPVRALPRSEWEKIGADRRKARLEALAPQSSPEATGGVGGKNPADGSTDASAAISAIIYGADWCKPCHDAERYLKSLGVAVTKKDIEESRAAQAEMQQKLGRVNRRGASIPVIDVMGKILVGYSPGSLKRAVDAVREAKGRPG